MTFHLSDCSGCMACMNICPKDAIITSQSKEGFIIPRILEDKCVHCGLCESVCDYKSREHIGNDIRRVYSFSHFDKRVLNNSSSGGAFTSLSDLFLDKGGVVFGAVFDNSFNVIHTIASNASERNRMRGSKYVQSNPQLSYREVKTQLIKRPVLFVGTPCQCAGLKAFLNNDYDNLVVVDFLCHGVSSTQLFKDHLSYIKKNHKGILVDYSFRKKKYGWNSYTNVLSFSRQSLCRTKDDSSWLAQAFLSFFSDSYSLRPSCFNCPYRNSHRPSDITIGDFWQIEYLTGKKDKNGVSFMSANSPKGEDIISAISHDGRINEYTIDQVQFRLPNGSKGKPIKYNSFWETYLSGGYESVLNAFFDNSFKARLRWTIKKIAKRLKIV